MILLFEIILSQVILIAIFERNCNNILSDYTHWTASPASEFPSFLQNLIEYEIRSALKEKGAELELLGRKV